MKKSLNDTLDKALNIGGGGTMKPINRQSFSASVDPYTSMILKNVKLQDLTKGEIKYGQKITKLPDEPIEFIKFKTLLTGDYSLTDASIPNIDIKPFRLYKMRFYGLGLKNIKPNIYTSDEGKKFFMYGNSHLLGTYIDVWFFALQEMSPLVGVIAVIAGIAGVLGISLIVLKKVQDASLILIPLALIPVAIIYRKPILKLLK